jgi:hypothetical protein
VLTIISRNLWHKVYPMAHFVPRDVRVQAERVPFPPLGKGRIEISMEFRPLAKIATNPAGVNPVGRLLNSGW